MHLLVNVPEVSITGLCMSEPVFELDSVVFAHSVWDIGDGCV